MLGTNKQIQDIYKRMGSYVIAANQMEKVKDQDRLNTLIGFLAQYVGGDSAKEYAKLNAYQSNILTSLGTSALKGALSNMDLSIIRRQVSDIRKSGAFNEGVLIQCLDKMMTDIDYSTRAFGGIQALDESTQAQYISFIKLRQALAEEK